MTVYVLAPNGTVERYPYSKVDLRLSRPDVSWPVDFSDETAAEFGVFPVTVLPQPTYDARTERLDVVQPVTLNGAWTQDWAVRQATPQEIQEYDNSLQNSIVSQTQARLDAFAQTRGYDDIKSASDYAGCSVQKFSVEGAYCRDSRAETWDALYTILAEVEAGTRPMPSGYADVEPLLPALVWPN